MSKWREFKIRDIARSNVASLDKSYPHKNILYLDTGSITCGKLDSYQNTLLQEAPSRARRLVKENDIIYSTVRPIQRHYGFITSPPENLVVSTGFSVIETNTEYADPKFIYYLLTSKEIVEYLETIAEGSTSTYPSLKPADIENLDILLPPLPEQRAIASILSSLDDKIDLLHRQNKTLETMAETLFKQWFVEEAEEGWAEVPLKEICVIFNGYAFQSSTYTGSGQKIIRTMNFSNHWIEMNDLVYISEKLATGFDRFFLQRNDFLLVMVGASIGNFAIVTQDVLPALQNQNMWRFRANKGISQHYLNFGLRQIINEALHGASGSAREFFQKGVFYELKIPLPPLELMRMFEETVESLFSRFEFNRYQIQTLEKLLDTLLPKLMSGEVKVQLEN